MLPVRINVEQFNPAMHPYERLSFKPIEDLGVYHLMEWQPVDRTGEIGVAEAQEQLFELSG